MIKLQVFKEPGDRFHPYTITNLEAMMNAAQDLSSNGFKLWMALSTYRSDKINAFRSTECCGDFGFTDEEFDAALEELGDKRYIMYALDTKKKKIHSVGFFEMTHEETEEIKMIPKEEEAEEEAAI